MSKSNKEYYFLNGGGEMGEIIRAKDWSKTPLGNPENWPQSLKTMVSVVLSNPFGMYIAWGKEYTQIYNDGYRPILGKLKHPNALGISTRETFSEIWHIIETMFDGVMDGTPVGFPDFMLPLDRNGFIEDCYFDFAYSPIRLDNGEVGGVLVTVIETTAKKIAQEQLKESEERFKSIADNIPNLAWMANPEGSVYWYNKKWYEYTGTTFEQMQGWGWQSIYKEELLEEVMKEWGKSLMLGMPLEIVSPLKGADGNYHQFLTRALPLKNDEGKIINWFGTNTDITEQKEVKAALIDNKNQLEFAIEAAQLGTFDYNPILDKLSINDRLKKWFGLKNNQDVELTDATNIISENDRSKVLNAIQEALNYDSGGHYDIAYNIINPQTKKEITLEAKGKVWFNEEKVAYRFNGTVEDITEQTVARLKLEQSESNLRLMILQAPIAIAIMRGKDYIVEIANKNALEIWGKTEDEIVNKSILKVMPELLIQGIPDLLDGVIATGIRYATTELPLTLVRFGKPETIYIDFSYEPLFDLEGNTNGIMAIGYNVTDQVLARQKIEKSEQNIRSLVESAPFPIGVYTGREMRITLANQSIIDTWGKGDDIIGKLYKEVLPELENQNIYQQLDEVFTTGIAFHAKNQKVELKKNGALKPYYFNYSFTPLYDSEGVIYGVMNTAAEVTELHEAKQKTEESEKRFRDAVQQAPTAMVIFKGINHIVETVNSSYLELIDKTEAEFLGKPLFESLPESESAVGTIIENIYKSGVPYYGYEFPIILNRFGKKEKTYFNFVYHPLKENDLVNGIITVATEVTATVKAKKALEESEQKLNIVINASELGIWELDVETNNPTISERAYEILGFKNYKHKNRAELLKNLHPDDKSIREIAFQKAYQTGTLHYEVRIIADNQIHWIEAKGKVFFNSENKPTRILGTLRDISEERNFQIQLLEREQKFRLLADSMPQFIWTADAEGNLNYYNQAVFDYSGLSRKEIHEKGWIEIVHEDDKVENIRKWMESITTEKDFLIEHRFRKYDGTYRWQLSRAIPQRDQDGKITMWVGTSTDIEEQKIFTNELEKQVKERTKELSQINESLEKSEERYHLMVEEIQDYAIIYLNQLGIIENWNIGAQKIKGYKAEEIIGKSITVFYTELDQKNNLPQTLLSIAKDKGKAVHEGYRVRKNGTLFWANIVITAVHNRNNELIGFSKITHDLTEKKVAEDKLKLNGLELSQKNEALEKMNKELQSFAYISSHDLQEPLRKIQTFASQIIEREATNLSESGMDKFKRMQNAANRMQNLIQDLLAYSRTSIQERKFKKTKLSIIIEEVKGDLEEEIILNNALITVNKDCEIRVIQFQFRQLLFNLISNSLKFIKENNVPEILIHCDIALGKQLPHPQLSKTTKYCHISIQDNGIGFEDEYNEKIFEVFQRLHGREEFHGTGIGLAIVKKIVDNHNGFISAKGVLNEGAVFDIYLPVD